LADAVKKRGADGGRGQKSDDSLWRKEKNRKNLFKKKKTGKPTSGETTKGGGGRRKGALSQPSQPQVGCKGRAHTNDQEKIRGRGRCSGRGGVSNQQSRGWGIGEEAKVVKIP